MVRCCPSCLAVVHPNRDKNRDRLRSGSLLCASLLSKVLFRRILAYAGLATNSDLILEWQFSKDLSGHMKGFCVGCEQRSRAYRLLVNWIRENKFLGARIDAFREHLRRLAHEKFPPVPTEGWRAWRRYQRIARHHLRPRGVLKYSTFARVVCR
jgi:hypothetical protein